MEHQTQITDESKPDHSSIHLTRITVPPTAAASSLIHAEYSRAQGDMVLTVHEEPQMIDGVAKILSVDPLLVSVHMAITKGVLVQAIYVDGKIRLGNSANIALGCINRSGIDFGQMIISKQRVW